MRSHQPQDPFDEIEKVIGFDFFPDSEAQVLGEREDRLRRRSSVARIHEGPFSFR